MKAEIFGGSGYQQRDVTWTAVQATGSWEFARNECPEYRHRWRVYIRPTEFNFAEELLPETPGTVADVTKIQCTLCGLVRSRTVHPQTQAIDDEFGWRDAHIFDSNRNHDDWRGEPIE